MDGGIGDFSAWSSCPQRSTFWPACSSSLPGETTIPISPNSALPSRSSANLLILGVFKYFDFFSLSIAAAFAQIGIKIDPVLVHVVLPIGISFYTFHAISYAVDVYRGDVAASRNYLDYLNFVMFFPQLVAGPIARASHLLPQVRASRFRSPTSTRVRSFSF